MRWHGPFDSLEAAFATAVHLGTPSYPGGYCRCAEPRADTRANPRSAPLGGGTNGRQPDAVALVAPKGQSLWIPGLPATFATRGEREWKETIKRFGGSVVPDPAHDGMVMEFVLETLAPAGQPCDLDNLCEPVFSVLINELGWLTGKRPAMRWWVASMTTGSNAGLRVGTGRDPSLHRRWRAPAFEYVFRGPSQPTRRTGACLSN